MELKTSFDFDFKAKSIGSDTLESTVFVSHIDCNDDSIACSGNGFVKLYDINNGQVVTYFGTGQKSLSDMQFANEHPNLLCTASSLNGVIAIYDVRCNNKSNSKCKSKQICLLKSPKKAAVSRALYSVAMDDHSIVGSATQDIYVWDKRTFNSNTRCRTLQHYHSDEVTKVRFMNNSSHKQKDTHLLSISEDTLMNQYDLKRSSPDPLVNTYSLEKELWHFGLFEHDEREFAYALSNDESLIVQHISDDKYHCDHRVLDTKTLHNMTLIDCFYDHWKQLCLLSCNEGGKVRLSSIDLDHASNNVTILSESMDGHHARIRCAKYIPKISCVLTGGEDNTVSMWSINSQTKIQSNPQKQTKHVSVDDQPLCYGYGAHHSAPDQKKTKRTVKHFTPY